MASAHSLRLQVERLERRELFSAIGLFRPEIVVSVKARPETADPNDRVLEIVGTDRRDSLVLRQTGSQVYLENVPNSVRNLAGITLITIDARGGNDLVSLGGLGTKLPVSISAVVNGGKGNDFLFGGTAGDQLHGDGGLDQIWGAGGDDLVDGGDGPDLLRGDTGTDTFIGRTIHYDQFLDRAAGEAVYRTTTEVPSGASLSIAAGEGLSPRPSSAPMRRRA